MLSLLLALPLLLAGDWAQWRGPAFRGVAADDAIDLPVGLGAEARIWTTQLPGPCSPTPAVAGGRIHVSSLGRLTHERAMAPAGAVAGEAGVRGTLEAIQVRGGYGYMAECEVERAPRDVRLLEIGAGPTEVHLVVIARELLGAAAR